MKTMTCQQLGGPCGLKFHTETADEMIKAQDKHLKDAVKAGDAAHEPARDEMKNRWKHPKQSMDWYNNTKKTFAELSED